MTTKNRLQEKNITNANTGLFKTGIKNCAGELVLPAQHTNTKSILYNLHSLKQRIAGINLHVVDSGCSAYRNVYHFACACIYLTAARLTTACVIYSYRINSFLCKTYIHFIYERSGRPAFQLPKLLRYLWKRILQHRRTPSLRFPSRSQASMSPYICRPRDTIPSRYRMLRRHP